MTGLNVVTDVGLLLGLRLQACHSLSQFHSQDVRNLSNPDQMKGLGYPVEKESVSVTLKYLTQEMFLIYIVYVAFKWTALDFLRVGQSKRCCQKT